MLICILFWKSEVLAQGDNVLKLIQMKETAATHRHCLLTGKLQALENLDKERRTAYK